MNLHQKPNATKLLRYGFQKNGTQYCYQTAIADGQFHMIVRIGEDGTLQTQVLDVATGEEYVLHRAPRAAGAFVGMVREAHDAVVREICAQCFDVEVFQSDDAKRLIAYVRDRYGDELEFLWEKFPKNAIWRRKDTHKWYGALLTVSKQKLGIPSDEQVEIIDLRLSPQVLARLIDHRRYYPGYHMNKQHWYTMLLDGSVPIQELCQRIDESHQLAVK